MGDDLDVDALLEEPYLNRDKHEERGDYGIGDERSRSRSAEKRERSHSRERSSAARGERRKSRSRSRERSSKSKGRRSRSRDRERRRKSRSRSRERRRRSRSRSRERRRRSRSRERHHRRSYSPTVGGRGGGRARRGLSRSRSRSRSPQAQLTPEDRDARTIFVMQLSQRCRARDVEEFFSAVGKIRDVKLIVCNKTRRFKGICYVEFKDLESVPLAMGLTGQKLLGVPVIVQPSQAEKNRMASYNTPEPPRNVKEKGPMRLYVGSLHFNITEDMLRGIFEPFGSINSIQLIKDLETGRSKGYGFITYNDAEDAKKALEQLNGFELAGRPMKVGHTNERTDNAVLGPTSNMDGELLDRSGVDLGATGRLALMAKLAEGTGMKLPQAANQALTTAAEAATRARHQRQAAAHVEAHTGQSLQASLPPGAPAPSTSQQPEEQQQQLAGMNPPIATQCFMLSNMFDPAQEAASNPNWDAEVRDDVIDECNKYGGVVHLLVDKVSESGNVYVKCPNIATAVAAVNALHGRWFAGKVITAAYVPLVNYHNLFPDSAAAAEPLATNR